MSSGKYSKLRNNLSKNPIPVTRTVPDISESSLREGLELKADGQQRALEAAKPWKDRAFNWIESSKRGRMFTADDLIRALGLPHPDETGPNRNNAVGSVFSIASRKGWIRRYGTSYPSQRKSSHGRDISVWVRR